MEKAQISAQCIHITLQDQMPQSKSNQQTGPSYYPLRTSMLKISLKEEKKCTETKETLLKNEQNWKHGSSWTPLTSLRDGLGAATASTFTVWLQL